MGIPHLTSSIQPYAQVISWAFQGTPADNNGAHKITNVIIDGPSFAYYIYNRSLNKVDASSALGIPSYHKLAEAAIAWLEELESFGIHVKHIFFDGFLPRSKTDTRYDRLSKSLIQLKAFRSSTSLTTHKRPSIPAAPFLVAAISDGLSSSKYNSVSCTVPCEAEAYCIKSASLYAEDVILTSDSDLLVLTEVNKIIFFNDLEIHAFTIAEKNLKAQYFDPAHIRKELGCDDLFRTAFLLTKHPNTTLKELAKRIGQDKPTAQSETSFTSFKQQFLPENQYSPFTWTESSNHLARVLRSLDARVSEFVHEWGTYLGTGTETYPLLGHTSNSQVWEAESRHMFLPFLIDDPVRASAWRPSDSVRTLAYSVLALYGPRFRMMEVDRRGDRILGVNVALITQPAPVVEACKTLFKSITKRVQSPFTASAWKYFAVHQVCSRIRDEGSNLPAEALVRNVCLQSICVNDWGFMHLSAQIQAYLYSLRILKQILQIFLAADIVAVQVERSILIKLLKKLGGLPPISEVMPGPGIGLGLAEDSVSELLLQFYPPGEDVSKDGFQDAKGKKKRKRKEKQDGQTVVPGLKQTSGAARNMYDLLRDL